ncbi:MAG: T9SS type A sorting domain-containing protein, partial [bacterium]
NFYNNSLTGEIPSEIGNLENLSSFSLSQNELSGAIPPELGSLANLESLYLYNNQFDELPDMSSLTNLYYCYINDNYFTFNDLKTAGLNPDDIPVYTYAPQEQLSKPDTSNIGGNEVELTVDDEATNNEYIWLKDGEPFDTTTTNNVTITLDETAEYFCKIKNPDFPDLTLETEKFVMGTDNYTVTFQVTNGGDPVEGAEITINASNLVTDAQGEATIDLPNETYDYTVTKSGYDDETGTLTVDGSDVTEEVVLTETRYTVTFSVKDEEDTPVESAIIDIDGETLTTDANGEAALDTVNGDYDYTITKTGYGDETGTLTVDGSAVTEEVVLTEMYTVTFSVTDEEDTPVESATIDIDGETLTTDDNGEATLDTVNGEYDYTVTAEGYEDAEGNVEIDGDDLTEEVSLTAVSTSIENPEGVNVTVYPIPASESVVVESNSVIESIRMFNLEGVVLKTLEPSSNQVSIDIREYATGYYMLHIKDDNGRMTTKQIIIE